MVMPDLHAVTSAGSLTTLAAISTIAAGGDGQSVAGVPINPGAQLIAWGAGTTIADVIEEAQLISQDQIDPINGEDFKATIGSSLVGLYHKETNLKFRTGKRVISMAQKTAAANNFGYYLDIYPENTGQNGSPTNIAGSRFLPQQVQIPQVFGGALTAITWGNVAFAPTNLPPIGTYAILGARVNALTNYALLRFTHADFYGYSPGFPVIDQDNTAVANAALPKYDIFNAAGWQFVYMSQQTGVACCPTFRITSAGSGLSIQSLAITADTPNVVLSLVKVG